MGLGVTTVLTGGFVSCGPDWSRSEYKPESYAKFYMVTHGRATYETQTDATELTPGQVYFFPPHQASRHTCQERMDLYWMHLSIDAPVLDMRLSRLRTIASWPVEEWLVWKPVYERLPELIASPSLELELRTQAMVMDGFARLLTRFPEEPDPELERLRSRLAPALQILDSQFKQSPPLALLAASSHLSVPHFHRSFSLAFRTTPHRYMLRRRMDLAHQLLCNTRMSVGDIAGQVGYDDQFYFSRAFKRYFKSAPERFRMAHGSGP
jgi:AraC-like DNA-binding protein